MLDHKGISEIVCSWSLDVSSLVVLILLFLGCALLLLLGDFMGKVKVPVSLAFMRRLAG